MSQNIRVTVSGPAVIGSRPNPVISNKNPQLKVVSLNYDMAIFIPGELTAANDVLATIVSARDVTFAENFEGSVGACANLPVSITRLNIDVNDTIVGSVLIAPNGQFSFANSGITDLNKGDRFTIRTDDNPDPAIADVSITFFGTKSGNL